MKNSARAQDKWSDISAWLEWWLCERRLSSQNQGVFERYYKSYIKNFNFYLKKCYARQSHEVLTLIRDEVDLLEIGCGCGTESIWFALKGARVVGVDLNEKRLSVARERVLLTESMLGSKINIEFLQQSLFDIDSDKKFDVIWMEQAFHHIEPRSEVRSKLYNLLRPGGHLVISEANGLNLALQFHLFLRRGTKTIGEFVDDSGRVHLYGIERITSARALVDQFVGKGFELASVDHFRIFPNFAFLHKISWLEGLVPKFLLPAFTHFNVVLRKTS